MIDIYIISMFGYLLIAIIIIAIICLVYWFYNCDHALRTGASEALKLSAGIYDKHAEHALSLLNRIADPLPHDHFVRGNILYHNVLGGREGIGRQNILTIRNIAEEFRAAAITDDPNILRAVNEFADFGAEMFNDDFIVRQMFGTPVPTINAVKRSAEIIATKAIEGSDSRIDAINTALSAASTYTDDRQNVHDSKVNADLRSVLETFRSSGDVDKCVALDEIEKFINRSKLDSVTLANARRGLVTAREGASISTYNDTEDNILATVWNRCNDPRNRDNRKSLREAVVISLADGIERNTQVCVNGRVSRVLNSLATIDFDPTVNGALTFEAYRNQAYNDVKDIVGRQLDFAESSSDPVLKAAAAAYNGGDDNEAAVAKLRDNIFSAIDTNLSSYAEKFTPNELESIRESCHILAGI